MTTKKGITRRIFLKLILFTGLILSAKFIIDKFTVFKSLSTTEFEEKLVKLFQNKESAKEVGLAYLKKTPKERDKQKLLTAISSILKKNHTHFIKADTPKLREWLYVRRQLDFEEGRLVEVQGWLLSITEAQLCALAALQPTLLEQIPGYLKWAVGSGPSHTP